MPYVRSCGKARNVTTSTPTSWRRKCLWKFRVTFRVSSMKPECISSGEFLLFIEKISLRQFVVVFFSRRQFMFIERGGIRGMLPQCYRFTFTHCFRLRQFGYVNSARANNERILLLNNTILRGTSQSAGQN